MSNGSESNGSEFPPPRPGRPQPAQEPSFAPRGRRSEFPVQGHGEIPDILRLTVSRMSASGPHAETSYQRALGLARGQDGTDVARVLSEAVRALPEDAYLDRLSLTQVATDLRDPALEEFLRRTVTAQLPPERGTADGHGFSTRAREVLIRMVAVEGLARLAADGSDTAAASLLDAVGHENRTVRGAAVAAVRGLDGDYTGDLRERLGPDDGDLLQTRRLRIEDVPQPTGGTYVNHPGAGDGIPPPDIP
ncbi:hypothetical protein [Streptomyces sp. NPDC057877]|uniref:hypothetical protein n=1 Tax=Streptomyces sp. NPDC057877 TaxID=3346269 RepID=UPI0036CF27AA